MSEDATSLLVDLDWLDRQTAPVLLIDARPADDYAAGHLPGAINLDTFFYVNEHTDPAGLKQIETDWSRMLGEAGITPEDRVVFYDAGTQNYAPRGAFMLRYLGHRESYVLHGGIRRLARGGPRYDAGVANSAADAGRPLSDHAQRAMIASADEVAAALDDPHVIVMDVRAVEEYRGEREMQGNPRLGPFARRRLCGMDEPVGREGALQGAGRNARDPCGGGRRAGKRDRRLLPAEPPCDEHLHGVEISWLSECARLHRLIL